MAAGGLDDEGLELTSLDELLEHSVVAEVLAIDEELGEHARVRGLGVVLQELAGGIISRTVDLSKGRLEGKKPRLDLSSVLVHKHVAGDGGRVEDNFLGHKRTMSSEGEFPETC